MKPKLLNVKNTISLKERRNLLLRDHQPTVRITELDHHCVFDHPFGAIAQGKPGAALYNGLSGEGRVCAGECDLMP